MARTILRGVLFALLIATATRAAIYENAVEIENEESLFELQQRGDLSDATVDTLLELIREGIDLNTASREQLYDLPSLTAQDVDAIVAYRAEEGPIETPRVLVTAQILSEEQLTQIAPFIRVNAATTPWPVSGRIRASTRFTVTDSVPPPALLSARLKGPYQLSAGFMLASTRLLASPPRYDPNSDALVTSGLNFRLNAPRLFLQWAPGKAKVVVGTFTLGFAERLTLDTSRRFNPNGIYLTDDFRRPVDLARPCRASSRSGSIDPSLATGCGEFATDSTPYVTADYSWRDVFRGVAASLEDVSLGHQLSTSLYGFFSYQSRAIYQYELYDRRVCEDPRDDNNPACGAPSVYFPDGSTRLVFSNLPAVFDELTSGGHLTLKSSDWLKFGVTGYGAVPIFHQQPLLLDFQEWSRYPSGGAFGALGFDAQAHTQLFHFYLEGSRSFDRRIGGPGGGFGIEQRSTFSPKGHEAELSLRFYDAGFGTPYSRPISAPDEIDGVRARNEAGARLRYLGRLPHALEFRARADFWVNPYAIESVSPAGVPNLYGLVRIDWLRSRAFQPAVWVDARNRNLLSNVRGGCASGITLTASGTPEACGGDLYRVAGRFASQPWGKKLSLVVQGSFTWADDPRYTDRFRNDVMLWAELQSRPIDALQLSLKSRYVFQDILGNTSLEQSSWTFIEGGWFFTPSTRLSLRYDVFVWLDKRASTLSRTPNPEHRLQIDLAATF